VSGEVAAGCGSSSSRSAKQLLRNYKHTAHLFGIAAFIMGLKTPSEVIVILFGFVLVSTAAIAPSARYVQQRQDHFDGGNPNTWQQAYYVNDSQWIPGSYAPVFLCIGGEGPPLDGSVVTASVHCNDAVEWLQETGAIMFAVEHRYYGCHNMSACPVTSFSSPDALRFLSSAQALEDLALFIGHATTAYNLTGSKWVSWGGR
jgi:hypothetical protein